ncbi:MAG: hypothetical protein ACI9JL_003764 [Paracoccaceae bacterium]|jgi:hypothetical protein
MKRLFFNLAIALIAITYLQIGGAQKAEAFCIYNHSQSNRSFEVIQVEGRASAFTAFRGHISPGKNQCCNWKTNDCNTSGKRDGKVRFVVRYSHEKNHPGRRYFTISAGGSMTCLARKDRVQPVCPPTRADLAIRSGSINSSTHTNVLLRGLNGKCLDIAKYNTKDGANVHLWTCHGKKNQRWNINRKGEIRSALNGKCLDAVNDKKKGLRNGSNVIMWKCYGPQQQRWELKHGQLIGPLNLCLDVSDRKGKNGTNVHAWKCHKGANQQWQIADKP